MDYRYTGQNNMYQPGQQFEQSGQTQSNDIQYNFGQQSYVRQDFQQGNVNQQFGQTNGYYSYAQKDNSFPMVNLIVSVAGLALMAF